MSFIRAILYPFSFLYGLILAIRNLLYNIGVFKITQLPVKIISVGNLSVGGTGKTPHVTLIAQNLKTHKSAIVLRGYGRKTKGVIAVDATKTIDEVGDEALTYFYFFKEEIPVFVAESRVEGVKAVLKKHPQTEVVILDDAFQHRSIFRDVNILLVDYNRPFWKDSVLPSGRLREFPWGRKRADLCVVTKVPNDLSEEVKREFVKRINRGNQLPVFFSKINYGELVSFDQSTSFPKTVKNILLVTGIANSKPLVSFLQEKYVVKQFEFKDHYDFTLNDIRQIHELFDKFAKEDKIILTTFKDFMRLNVEGLKKELSKYPWFYQPIQVEIDDENMFNTHILANVRKN